jgi:putative Ca2+/H+ antiporter (TMEM165/GDT1 family)
MDWKALALVFATVFVAELGDKTQLATVLFAADREVSPWLVFAGASAALVVSAGLGVIAGTALSHLIDPRHLAIVAGVGFIAIGAWTLWSA